MPRQTTQRSEIVLSGPLCARRCLEFVVHVKGGDPLIEERDQTLDLRTLGYWILVCPGDVTARGIAGQPPVRGLTLVWTHRRRLGRLEQVHPDVFAPQVAARGQAGTGQ